MNATLAHALRLLINPLRRMRPSAADVARHTGDAPLPLADRPLATSEWFAQMEEHFPRSYLHAYAADLDQLRAVNGCSPVQAAAYALAYMGAPTLA